MKDSPRCFLVIFHQGGAAPPDLWFLYLGADTVRYIQIHMWSFKFPWGERRVRIFDQPFTINFFQPNFFSDPRFFIDNYFSTQKISTYFLNKKTIISTTFSTNYFDQIIFRQKKFPSERIPTKFFHHFFFNIKFYSDEFIGPNFFLIQNVRLNFAIDFFRPSFCSDHPLDQLYTKLGKNVKISIFRIYGFQLYLFWRKWLVDHEYVIENHGNHDNVYKRWKTQTNKSPSARDHTHFSK